MARVHVVVTGRVQGVSYRAFAVQAARQRSLRGWVRNLPDGRVEVEAEGDRADLDEFIHDLQHGPPLARVDHVHVEWVDPTGMETDFRIVY